VRTLPRTFAATCMFQVRLCIYAYSVDGCVTVPIFSGADDYPTVSKRLQTDIDTHASRKPHFSGQPKTIIEEIGYGAINPSNELKRQPSNERPFLGACEQQRTGPFAGVQLSLDGIRASYIGFRAVNMFPPRGVRASAVGTAVQSALVILRSARHPRIEPCSPGKQNARAQERPWPGLCSRQTVARFMSLQRINLQKIYVSYLLCTTNTYVEVSYEWTLCSMASACKIEHFARQTGTKPR
jgi:hypothetical protein